MLGLSFSLGGMLRSRVTASVPVAMLACSLCLAACSGNETYRTAVSDQWSSFGTVQEDDPKVRSIAEVTAVETNGPVVLAGVVRGVCQTKGCWMTLSDDSASDPVFVRFRDYGFFVPRNAAGRHAMVYGTPVVSEVSVDLLRHYAMDAGQSEEEAMLIIEPQRRLEFVADSVMIQGPGLVAAYVAPVPESCDPALFEPPPLPEVGEFRVEPATPVVTGGPDATGVPDVGEYRSRPNAAMPAIGPAPAPQPEPAAQEPVGSSILDD